MASANRKDRVPVWAVVAAIAAVVTALTGAVTLIVSLQDDDDSDSNGGVAAGPSDPGVGGSGSFDPPSDAVQTTITVNPGIATTVLLGAETNLEGANARSTGSSDSLTATIDWGDETAADNLQLPSLNGPIDASHVYSSSGQFSGVILVNNQFGDRGRVVFTAEVRVAADIAPVPPDVKFDEILLHNGTSIVSVPWRLQDPNVNAVFTSPSVVSVSSIDAAIGTFASAVRDAGTGDLAGDLTEIEPGLGYLVVTTAAATIPLLIDTGAPATPITLYPGWNLIGYAPSVLKPWMTVDDYLADLNNEWQALYTWDQEAGVWLAAAPPGATLVPGFGGFAFGLPAPQFQDVTDNPLHFVSAGQGYWIYSSETRVLTP